MNPNVIHVIDQLEPGGAQQVVLALTEGNPFSHVCALYASPDKPGLGRSFPGAQILAYRKSAVPAILYGLIRLILQHRSTAIFNAHLQASTLLLCLLRKLFDFKLVVTLHARMEQWPRWFRRVFRTVIFSADHVIADSKLIYEEARALGLNKKKLTLIPIGTLRAATDPRQVTVDIRRELGIAAGMPVFLNIARMVPGKGQMHLVRAMVSVPDAVAVLVGDGPEEQRLRAEIGRLGLERRVFLAGRRTDLENYYPVAIAFVMPCLDESMGIVIYDALTCRLPVIAYASGSIGEIVTDGENGLLLPVDTDALAAAMRKILSGDTRFSFLAPETYSAAPMVDRHNKLYMELAGKWLDPEARKADA